MLENSFWTALLSVQLIIMSIRKIIFIAIFTTLALYTGWTIIFGKNGLRTFSFLAEKKKSLLEQQSTLEASKAALEKKVKRMRSSSLDTDSVDENARKNLGYAQEDEKIYLE